MVVYKICLKVIRLAYLAFDLMLKICYNCLDNKKVYLARVGFPTLDFLMGGVIVNKKELMKKLVKMCDESARSLDYELVDVEYVKESGSYYLRVYIDKKAGITLDDCQSMSELLGEKLDKEDPIENAYYLEVSSPGLDRPLKNDRDLKRNLGKDIEISLYKPLENKKKFEGNLKFFTEDKIVIKINDDEMEIPRDAISVIKLALKF
jgi:ribosome maturation factor RimP